MPSFSGSYEGASFFELLRHDFPHLLPFQHLHHVPQLGASELRLTEAGGETVGNSGKTGPSREIRVNFGPSQFA